MLGRNAADLIGKHAWTEFPEARGQKFMVSTGTAAEIGAATGIEFLGDGKTLAAAEPVRRGGGSAMAITRENGHGGRRHAWRGGAHSRR